jgi:4-hydroxybenzoate polyprenyltransferase
MTVALPLKNIIPLLRPLQWVKNFFVFAPLLFSGVFKNATDIAPVCYSFLLFSLASSIAYVFNDMNDIVEDRRHPTKSFTKPLACGLVSPQQAISILSALVTVLSIGLFLDHRTLLPITLYLILNIAYTLWLKRIPFLDLITIASFFILRIYGGARAAEVEVSFWMLAVTLSLALYLASIKRHQELLSSGTGSRHVLNYYSPSLIAGFTKLFAVSTVSSYSLYVWLVRPELWPTVLWVALGIFRYSQIVESHGAGESPIDLILKDRILVILIFAWLTTTVFLMEVL